jgi:integrase
MPLELKSPRAGKSPNYSIRGTYYGVRVDRTTGTPDKAKARKYLQRIKADIESGAYTPPGAVTFAGAALSYIRAGHSKRFLEPLSNHFTLTPIASIKQADIDEAAHKLYPDATAATRNRQVYTPVSAIMKHAGEDYELRRPKGAEGEVRTNWLRKEQAEALINAAHDVDEEFGVFLSLLLYTGLRLSEALWLKCSNVDLSENFAYIPDPTKNGDPRPLHLPPALVAELASHPRGLDRPDETVCRFRKNGYLYNLMKVSRTKAGLGKDVTFHTMRHTWATWMRRYANLDTKGLVGTGAWKDEKSAARYQHIVVSEEAKRADMLPVMNRKTK